jgi:hypothetical protein
MYLNLMQCCTILIIVSSLMLSNDPIKKYCVGQVILSLVYNGSLCARERESYTNWLQIN